MLNPKLKCNLTLMTKGGAADPVSRIDGFQIAATKPNSPVMRCGTSKQPRGRHFDITDILIGKNIYPYIRPLITQFCRLFHNFEFFKVRIAVLKVFKICVHLSSRNT